MEEVVSMTPAEVATVINTMIVKDGFRARKIDDIQPDMLHVEVLFYGHSGVMRIDKLDNKRSLVSIIPDYSGLETTLEALWAKIREEIERQKALATKQQRSKVYNPVRRNIEDLISYKISLNESALRANSKNPPRIKISYNDACRKKGIPPDSPAKHMPRLASRFQDPHYWPDPKEIPEIPESPGKKGRSI